MVPLWPIMGGWGLFFRVLSDAARFDLEVLIFFIGSELDLLSERSSIHRGKLKEWYQPSEWRKKCVFSFLSTRAFFWRCLSPDSWSMPFYQALCFFLHTSSIHGGQFGMTVKTKPKWTFFLQGKNSQKAGFSVDIDSRDRSLFLTRL